MKNRIENLHDAIGEISPDIINEADLYVPEENKSKIRLNFIYSPLTALIAVVIIIGAGLYLVYVGNQDVIEPPNPKPDKIISEPGPRVKYICHGKEFIPLEYLIGYEVPEGQVGGELMSRLPQDVTDEIPAIMLYKSTIAEINFDMFNFDVKYGGTYSNLETYVYDSNFNLITTGMDLSSPGVDEYYIRTQGRWDDLEDSYGWCEYEYFIKIIIGEQREMTLADVRELTSIGENTANYYSSEDDITQYDFLPFMPNVGERLTQYDFLPFIPNSFDTTGGGIVWRAYELSDIDAILTLHYGYDDERINTVPWRFRDINFWIRSEEYGSIDLGCGLPLLDGYLAQNGYQQLENIDPKLRSMTLDDLNILANKGENLVPNDFQPFVYSTPYSGRFAILYDVGVVGQVIIEYFYDGFTILFTKTGSETSIDLRYDDLNEYLASH